MRILRLTQKIPVSLSGAKVEHRDATSWSWSQNERGDEHHAQKHTIVRQRRRISGVQSINGATPRLRVDAYEWIRQHHSKGYKDANRPRIVGYAHLQDVTAEIFLICRRARRQRSQSPILVTVRIDKHFKLYIDWSLSGKCSQLASQVMEQSSMFLLTAQSAERKMASFTIQLLNTSITQNCTCKGRFSIALRQNGTYRRALNCMPQWQHWWQFGQCSTINRSEQSSYETTHNCAGHGALSRKW